MTERQGGSITDTSNRTFQLFNYIGIKLDTRPALIPYYMKDILGVCPWFFNNVSKIGNFWKQAENPSFPPNQSSEDHFGINSGLPPDAQIPNE